MQNDVLKNEIAPWQEEGRWYHGVFDYATSALIAEKTDDYIINHITFRAISVGWFAKTDDSEHFIIDSKMIADSDFRATSNTSIYFGYYMLTIGTMEKLVFPTGTAGTVEFWLFIN